MSLHIKIFLQIALIFCIIFVFGGYGFINTIESVFKHNAQENIKLDLKRVQNEIDKIKGNIQESANSIQNTQEIISSVNLISNYEDKNSYKASIFDIEKQKLINSLQRWINNDTIGVSIYDNQKNLIAKKGFFDGQSVNGYITYRDNEPFFVSQDGSSVGVTYENDFDLQKIQTSFSQGYYNFTYATQIQRDTTTIGFVELQYGFGMEELEKLQNLLISQIYFQTKQMQYILPTKWNQTDIEHFNDSTNYEVLSKMVVENENSLYVMHVIDKNFIEESKYQFLFQMVIFIFALLLVSFLLFWVFSQRTIIKPLTLLIESIDLIKKDEYKKITYHSKDEMGKIIENFNDIFEKLSSSYSFLQSYQTAVDKGNVIIFIDTQRKIKHVNEMFEKVSGYSKEEALGKDSKEFLDIGNEVYNNIWDTMESHNVWQGVVKNKKKNDEVYWSDTVVSPILDGNLQIKEYIAVKRDITKEKLAQDEKEQLQKKIRDQNYLLQSILDTAPIGIWLNDKNANVLMQNRWVTQNIRMNSEQIKACQNTDHETLQKDTSLIFYEDVTFVDDKIHTIETIKTKLTDYKGNVIGVLGIGLDVTEKIQQQQELQRLNSDLHNEVQVQIEQLRQKEKMLQEQSKLAAMGEMMSAIAHQWRQPLNALSINIQNLEEDYEDGLIDEKFLEKFVHKQTKMIEFMSKTIDDFRNFFQTDKKKTVFSMKEVVKAVEHLIDAQLKSHNIKIVIKGEDFEIEGYKSEMQQVILNIVSNSKDAILSCRKNGVIEVEFDKENKIISISDNGGGMDQKILDRIFEPYFTTKEQGKGTGIGLHMSRVIVVEHMHGQMRAFNKKDGLCMEIQL